MMFGKLLKKVGAISLAPIVSSVLYLELSLSRTNILDPWRFEIERFYCTMFACLVFTFPLVPFFWRLFLRRFIFDFTLTLQWKSIIVIWNPLCSLWFVWTQQAYLRWLRQNFWSKQKKKTCGVNINQNGSVIS